MKYYISLVIIAIVFYGLKMTLNKNLGSDFDWIEIMSKNINIEIWTNNKLLLEPIYSTKIDRSNEQQAFYILKTEVSCKSFLTADLDIPKNRMEQINFSCEFDQSEPITGVQLKEAESYCKSIGGKLPTEIQWTNAAIYLESTLSLSNSIKNLESYVVNVNDASIGVSGLKGMIGNVWEMTRTPWENDSLNYIIKGGAFNLVQTPNLLNPILKASHKSSDILNRNVGFRCIKE